jgi:hypothetical protein
MILKIMIFLFSTGLIMWMSFGLTTATRGGYATQSTALQAPAKQTAQAFDQTQKLAELRRQLAGKERTPAEQVYQNIRDYKGIPAAGLLRGMEFYTRALGVDCAHCHVLDQWEKDDKPAKQIARDMSALVDTIQEALKKIKNL